VDQAKGQRWPQVSVGASSPSYFLESGRSLDGNDSRVESNLQVVTPVYDFGAIRHDIAGKGHVADDRNRCWSRRG
jgi:adhesin transport system outer membrane protein